MLLRMQLRTKDHDGNRLSIVKTFTAVPSQAVRWLMDGLGRPGKAVLRVFSSLCRQRFADLEEGTERCG